MERRVQRPCFDLEEIVRRSLDVLGDGVPVRGSEEQRAKNQDVERALKQLHTRGGVGRLIV